MLPIRTGARRGLRCGVFGFAAAVLTISGDPTQAAPYADIVVDANSGNVLHATNPDARRHPASLTKIMTLYLLFEQIEAGKLKLDSQLKVSAEAAGQSPTKLGLKAGSTIQVEDAIKGIITRSANDAAVAVAEAIAGDEDDFAKLMTRKAQALGMSRTVYKNASGLPDDGQVTTARDQATLGRAIQERFPKYYKYFSIRSFTFRGQSISNHNRLLGKVEGVDGIKTGYINASGFNLVTSVHRGNRYVVAVVIGGASAGSRDARMRELINDRIAQASTKRTAAMVAEAGAASGAKAELKSATRIEPESKPGPKAKAEAKAEPKFAVASATGAPVRANSPAPAEPASTAAIAPPRAAVGSTDPIRPVLVKTVTVNVAATQSASPATLKVSAPPAGPSRSVEPARLVPPPAQSAKPEPPAASPPAAAKTEPAALAATPEPRFALASAASVPARLQPSAPQGEAAATRSEPAEAATQPPAGTRPTAPGGLPGRASEPATAAMAPSPAPSRAATPAKTPVRSGWMIQVGAYPAEQDAKQRLAAVRSKASKILTGADPFTESVEKGGTTYYRARFAGLDKDTAEAACKYLKRNDVDCVPIKN